MSGTSRLSTRITLRLPNETYHEIERLIKESPRNPYNTVYEYCVACIFRYTWRHSITKNRRKPY